MLISSQLCYVIEDVNVLHVAVDVVGRFLRN
jgi:hypothetical protein